MQQGHKWREGKLAGVMRVIFGCLALLGPLASGAPSFGWLLLGLALNMFVFQAAATILIWAVKLLVYGVRRLLPRRSTSAL